jgi:hypothetical protein
MVTDGSFRGYGNIEIEEKDRVELAQTRADQNYQKQGLSADCGRRI